MIANNENALICDFAEIYHVYDYKSMPPRLAAILAVGLPDDSRIKHWMTGQRHTSQTLLMAQIIDALNTLVWIKTEDGQKGRNRPESLFQALTEEPKAEYEAFDSIEAYEAARKERIANG